LTVWRSGFESRFRHHLTSKVISECTFCSSVHPGRVEAMVALWEQYQADNTVLDISFNLAEKVK